MALNHSQIIMYCSLHLQCYEDVRKKPFFLISRDAMISSISEGHLYISPMYLVTCCFIFILLLVFFLIALTVGKSTEKKRQQWPSKRTSPLS